MHGRERGYWTVYWTVYLFVPNDDTQNDEICNLKKGGNIVDHCIGERGFGNLNSLLKSN